MTFKKQETYKKCHMLTLGVSANDSQYMLINYITLTSKKKINFLNNMSVLLESLI